jgi:hypothetical protein
VSPALYLKRSDLAPLNIAAPGRMQLQPQQAANSTEKVGADRTIVLQHLLASPRALTKARVRPSVACQ